MLTGTTRSTGSLLLMLFGISCHVAASSIPGSFALQGGEPSTQARLEMTTAGKDHLTRQRRQASSSRSSASTSASGRSLRDIPARWLPQEPL